ncbi:MAG TPA: carbamoyltransferase HypF [bacterium]|nr:carbamoyltransferase HypF [bacterium]
MGLLLVNGYRAVVRGQVQGLGFRPFVYRLAADLGVRGFVRNSSRGVVILAQGRNARRFLDQIRQDPPPLAVITSFSIARSRTRPFRGFSIRTSRTEDGTGVDVIPDLAVCPDCLREARDPHDRRYRYPFTNCTQCGPRYTIIQRLPYDRPNTTMAGFRMCAQCLGEYTDPSSRRYHAQPIACPNCGPTLAVRAARSREASRPPIEAAACALLDGRIVAIKSLGGFQLACDATNGRSVELLRARKRRPAKPFALMCENVVVARRFCRVSRSAEEVMVSAAAPIALLPKSPRPTVIIANAVAPGNRRLGVMLPYTPLHVLLFEQLRRESGKPAVLVMTSANHKEDPIIADDAQLASELGAVPDMVLTHDRPIANRCDDSVVLTDMGVPSPVVSVRRARGYAPQPVRLGRLFHVKHPVLAVGAEYKNAFALARGGQVFLGPHIGTVTTAAGTRFWLDTFARYTEWTRVQPEVVAADLHPDYAAARLAEQLSSDLGVPLVRVQHHHAHVLSAMAEHDIAYPVLGIAFDGTGYGTDGAIWGGEFLLVRDRANWQRVGHLGYLSLANAGDEVADPARVARTYLIQARAWERSGVSSTSAIGVLLTSSMGRLFDAAAAMTGACRSASFDGQAPTALEALAESSERGHWYSPDLLDLSASPALLRPEPILLHVARETSAGVRPATVAARFHNTLSQAAVALAGFLCDRHGIAAVCLSGGSFQNSLLLRGVVTGLRSLGKRVYWNQAVPLNDGGIALGQAVAAAACLSQRHSS